METWFVNPAFVAGGAALVASPVIIHLINRMRFRRVRFAAMEFLLQSQKRNRRRVLLEQLLLLLLRILIVLALVALIARLILDPSQLALFQGARTHHVVLLDDSGSMRDRIGEETAFEEALNVVRKLAAEGSRRPGTQKMTLMMLSKPEQAILPQRNVNGEFLSELDVTLENLTCSYQTLDLVSGLDAAGKLLASEKATVKHVHVISDFRSRDWEDQKALSGAVRTLESTGVAVNLVKTVSNQRPNLAVTRLTGDLHVAAAGVPVRFNAAVKNFSSTVAEDVGLIVMQDGQKLPLTIQFQRIEPGTEVDRDFYISFDSAKKHNIQVSLKADSLSQDNIRHLAMDISPVNHVLIIDGNPSGEEGAYIADALSPEPGSTEYSPLVESVDFLRRKPLDDFQSIYMLNVSELPLDALEPLEEYVKGGGGLAWFLGDSIRPSFYNERLYKEGQGVFPVRLANAPRDLPSDDSETPVPDLKLSNHPIFGIFQGQENPYIEATNVVTYFPVASDWEVDDQLRDDDVATIASLRNNQPFIFEHRHGAGTVFTCLTTCGPAWNNMYAFGSYVVLLLEAQRNIARTDNVLERRVVGEPIVETFDSAEFSEVVEVTAPDVTGERTSRFKATAEDVIPNRNTDDNQNAENSGSVRIGMTFRETEMPGIYVVRLVDRDQVPREQWLAYNVPAEESDLALATNEEIRKQIGEDVKFSIQEPGNLRWIEGKDVGQEVRDALLFFLVLLLVAEQFMAYRLSYHPATAGATA